MIQEQLNSANAKCQYVILSLYYFPCSRYFSSSKCDFRAQWETNHLGLITILPVNCLFFALQEIDLWMSLNSLRMTFPELRTTCCWESFRLTKLTGVTEQALVCDGERPLSLVPLPLTPLQSQHILCVFSKLSLLWKTFQQSELKH